MKLYHSPQSRSGRPLWLLEELGVPYEVEKVNTAAKENKTPEYLKIHPHGVVPALVDGDLKLMESAAICLYLADKYPEKGLAPKVGTPERGQYYQWIVYTMATLEPPVLQVFLNTVMLPEDQRSPEKVTAAKKDFETIGKVLSAALEGKDFLVGNTFSAADVMVASTLGWASFMGLLADFPTLQAYVGRCMGRPAAVAAQAK